MLHFPLSKAIRSHLVIRSRCLVVHSKVWMNGTRKLQRFQAGCGRDLRGHFLDIANSSLRGSRGQRNHMMVGLFSSQLFSLSSVGGIIGLLFRPSRKDEKCSTYSVKGKF